MRTPKLSFLLGIVLVALVACSEGSGGGSSADAASGAPAVDAASGAPDAGGVADARADARIELGTDAGNQVGGFGQKCSQTVACPVDAPICVVSAAGGTEGLCSIVCADDFRFTTDGAGNITTPPGPTADRACAAVYSGGVGASVCQAFLSNTFAPPVTGRPSPSTPYTGDVACAIKCGAGNTCPSGLRCVTAQQVCAP